MVQAVRDAESAVGRPSYEVNQMNRRGGRSLYVSKDIRKGDLFTANNVRSVRPSCGLHPKYYDAVLGRKATVDLAFGTPLKLSDVEGLE